MPHKCETPAGTGASRTSCLGWFRDFPIPIDAHSQPIPALIALHIGERFCALWSEGANHV